MNKDLLNKINKPDAKEVITIVSGLPRSGTSMMMKMLEAGGMAVLVDNIRSADDDNPQGYYEFEAAKTLSDGGVEWMPDAQGKVVKIIAALLPYLPQMYQYRIFFMHRNLSEILASQLKMLQNRGHPSETIDVEKMSIIYEKHVVQVMNWVKTHSNVQLLNINYNQLLQDPTSQIDLINEFAGRCLDLESMKMVINPDLYRHRKCGK